MPYNNPQTKLIKQSEDLHVVDSLCKHYRHSSVMALQLLRLLINQNDYL